MQERKTLFANGKNETRFNFTVGCMVTLTTNHEEGEAICELQHVIPMDDEAAQRFFLNECGKGWTFLMTN